MVMRDLSFSPLAKGAPFSQRTLTGLFAATTSSLAKALPSNAIRARMIMESLWVIFFASWKTDVVLPISVSEIPVDISPVTYSENGDYFQTLVDIEDDSIVPDPYPKGINATENLSNTSREWVLFKQLERFQDTFILSAA
jgi:hypothetical protein